MLSMRNQVNTPNQTGTADSNTCQSDSTVLEEMKKLRKENQDEHNHTKMAFDRLEQTVSVIKNQLAEHGKRFGGLEDRVSTAEDTGTCCTMIQTFRQNVMISRRDSNETTSGYFKFQKVVRAEVRWDLLEVCSTKNSNYHQTRTLGWNGHIGHWWPSPQI